ncbi:MAG: hypothetical protein ABSF13_13555 [Smithella sp.]|jgi:hypothetical protein
MKVCLRKILSTHFPLKIGLSSCLIEHNGEAKRRHEPAGCEADHAVVIKTKSPVGISWKICPTAIRLTVS